VTAARYDALELERSCAVLPAWGGPLLESDYAALALSWITREIAEEAMLRRVDAILGREVMGQKGNRDCSGILFPGYWPGEPYPHSYRIRRDNPDWTESSGKIKAKAKYLGAPGSTNRLYIPPGVTPEQLADIKIPMSSSRAKRKLLHSGDLPTGTRGSFDSFRSQSRAFGTGAEKLVRPAARTENG